jgi:hypothetical protein
MPPRLSGAVEGTVDEAVARRLAAHVGGAIERMYIKNGKIELLNRLRGFNAAARVSPWFVLVDLDGDADCAPSFVRHCLPEPSAQMCFRVTVRAVESWLIADTERLARFLSVPMARVPIDPDDLADPKATVVQLARASRSRIFADVAPRPGSGRRVGPTYTTTLVEFTRDRWRPDVAATRSDSLARCIASLDRLVRA